MTATASWQRCGILVAALLLATPDAFACSRPLETMSRAQVETYARIRYAQASAVIDAEVEQAMLFGPDLKPGLMPMAILRVIRRYKGVRKPGDDRIVLTYLSSCDISVMGKGERVRILLQDGPDLFRSDQTANGPNSDREGAQAEFNAEIDRLTGTPRPAGFSSYPGELEPPVDEVARAREIQVRSNAAASKRAAVPIQSSTVKTGIYIVGALGLLLAFLAGFLIGRRRKPAAG